MARFSDIRYRGLAQRFGSGVSDFTQSSKSVAEQVFLDWSNESIDIMRKELVRKSKSKSQSTAESISPLATETATGVNIKIQSPLDYIDYINKGVKGVKNKNKAPNSPYSFKNLSTPPAMVNSFKKWIANSGIKVVDGKKTAFKGKSRKKALSDQNSQAKTLAVRTKIGGIEPKGFIDKAINKKRISELSANLTTALGEVIKVSISNYGDNNK